MQLREDDVTALSELDSIHSVDADTQAPNIASQRASRWCVNIEGGIGEHVIDPGGSPRKRLKCDIPL
jgi:hypothetical protein